MANTKRSVLDDPVEVKRRYVLGQVYVVQVDFQGNSFANIRSHIDARGGVKHHQKRSGSQIETRVVNGQLV